MTLPYAPGNMVAGKYRVERVLGQGGMGLVLSATDVTLDRRVALKVMLPDKAGDREGLERFLREGRAAVKLTSDHVARVYEVGVSDGAAFLVMEYLDGLDLEKTLERLGRVDPRDAADYVLHACEAIAEAHKAGIVHRDLKPQNVFLARRPNGRAIVKVLDFGISKVEGADAAKLTKSGAALGTPLYMAPEQMRSARTVDQRADIWALGVLLYELVTGRPPFKGESIPEVVMAVTSDTPATPRSLHPELSEEMENVILRCLRKDPAERYPDVAALVADLEPLGSGRSWVAEPPADPSPPPSAMVTLEASGSPEAAPAAPARHARTDASWGTTARAAPRSRGSRQRNLVAGALGAAAVVGGFLVFRSRTSPVDVPVRPAEIAPAASSPAPLTAIPPAAPAPPSPSPSPSPSQQTAAVPAPVVVASASVTPVRAAPPPVAPHPARRQAPAAPIDPGSVR